MRHLGMHETVKVSIKSHMQDGTAAQKVLLDNIVEHLVDPAWEKRGLHSITRVTSSSTCFSSASSQREQSTLFNPDKLVKEGTEII